MRLIPSWSRSSEIMHFAQDNYLGSFKKIKTTDFTLPYDSITRLKLEDCYFLENKFLR